jgi:ATP-dependent Lon protease
LRSGIKTVLIPKDNKKNLTEISKDVTDKLKIIPIEMIEDGIKYVFGNPKIKYKKS